MILVVADTSPLNYLAQIECQELLEILYKQVLVPGTVFEELGSSEAPAAVSAWIRNRPGCLEIRQVSAPFDPTLSGLDPGEREAIQLARNEHADLLLIDERAGAKLAKRLGPEVTGTLGVLLQAARSGIIEIEAKLDLLQKTGFRYTPQLLDRVRRIAGERTR